MDVKREGVVARKRIKAALFSVVAIAAVGAAGWQISQLEPASPSVERATVWVDTVKKGPMVLERKGLGTLVPEEILWIPAQSSGQVKRVLVQSGEQVTADTILLELSNPDMELEANDLEWQIKRAEATLANLRVTLQSQTFDQEAQVTQMETSLRQSELERERTQQLYDLDLTPELELRQSITNYELAANRYENEKRKLEIMQDSVDAQIESQQVQIDQLRATWERRKQQVAELVIRAGTNGVLQEMTLEAGQQVAPGTVLAKVAQPWRLKAELKIAETQAKDILLGQKAMIDTRNGIIPAHVVRIDPNVVNGTRTVDCELDGELPSGAVPDLSVDGTIEIQRLDEVVYIGRPVFGQPDSQISLFRLSGDGETASRVPVRLGRGSVTTIEVVEGLQVGDQVILSDMSSQDDYDKISLD